MQCLRDRELASAAVGEIERWLGRVPAEQEGPALRTSVFPTVDARSCSSHSSGAAATTVPQSSADPDVITFAKDTRMIRILASCLLATGLLSSATPNRAMAAPAVEVAAAPDDGPQQELNLNLFRNPSIGIEYRRGAVAVHGGLYPTVISQDATGTNETSWFVRAGVTTFFLGHSFYRQRPSEFYLSGSYLRGLNLGHGNAALAEAGYRWMVWRGINLRLGVAALFERGEKVKFNPTPGIGWSQSF
jgi:hypothetical protein